MGQGAYQRPIGRRGHHELQQVDGQPQDGMVGGRAGEEIPTYDKTGVPVVVRNLVSCNWASPPAFKYRHVVVVFFGGGGLSIQPYPSQVC